MMAAVVRGVVSAPGAAAAAVLLIRIAALWRKGRPTSGEASSTAGRHWLLLRLALGLKRMDAADGEGLLGGLR